MGELLTSRERVSGRGGSLNATSAVLTQTAQSSHDALVHHTGHAHQDLDTHTHRARTGARPRWGQRNGSTKEATCGVVTGASPKESPGARHGGF